MLVIDLLVIFFVIDLFVILRLPAEIVGCFLAFSTCSMLVIDLLKNFFVIDLFVILRLLAVSSHFLPAQCL